MNTVSKNNKQQFAIVLCGPTAVGKSAVLYQILKPEFEIINADSLQVYKHLDIGTAKPAAEQLAAAVHHLIDYVDPASPFNAGDFIRCTEKYFHDIHSRHKVPVICGGTAFYIKSFLYGLPDLPGDTGAIRRELEKAADRHGCRHLYLVLQRVDPRYAVKISANDRLRIIRALEVYRSTGRPLSSFPLSNSMRTDYRFLLIGLERPREELYECINLRVEGMFAAGLVDEIRCLLKMGYAEGDPGMQGIGYKEFFKMQRLSLTLAQVKELIQRNSRRYAKRQLTFFKTFDGMHWFHPDEAGKIDALIKNFLRKNGNPE